MSFFFSPIVGELAGVKAALCESSGMAKTLVASPATPCTLFYDLIRCGSLTATLFHWTSSPQINSQCSYSPNHLSDSLVNVYEKLKTFNNEHVASLRDIFVR